MGESQFSMVLLMLFLFLLERHIIWAPDPNCLTVVAMVEKVFHHFLLLLTKREKLWAYETPLFDIVPDGDAVLNYELEENGHFRPECWVLDLSPDTLLSFILIVPLQIVGFFDQKISSPRVPPSKNIRAYPSGDFPMVCAGSLGLEVHFSWEVYFLMFCFPFMPWLVFVRCSPKILNPYEDVRLQWMM